MSDESLKKIVEEVENFKEENINQVKKNIDTELEEYKKTLPQELDTPDFNEKVQTEVDEKLSKLKNDMDIKPTALYYSLKADLELNEDISKKDLTISAYDFLEENTKSKFLKKILKELKKEEKNG